MLNSRYLFGILLVSIAIYSCAAHKYKGHAKPCDCPDNIENKGKKKHSEYKFQFKENLNMKLTTNHFA
jgi:hypothetical protein